MNKELAISRWRYTLLLLGLFVLPGVALWHIAGLQVVSDTDRGFRFLQDQGKQRTLRTETIPAYRGLVTDRHGQPLAVSTPVVSLWLNPQMVDTESAGFGQVVARLNLDKGVLQERIQRYGHREFLYLARHLTPSAADRILDLNVVGVHGQREYRRFYPAGEVAAQLVGFTNIDDKGQEGMELAYDGWLAGQPGAKRVLKDRHGRVIKDVGLIRSEKSGRDIALSIDMRLQYLAYRELKAAVSRHRATSGSLVMLDADTGEVLAMVNQPSFNPNNRAGLDTAALRNRAVTDLLEPGSTVKPLTMATALESDEFQVGSEIDTSPGWIWLAGKTFQDESNYGVLDMTGILTKSSQVGITKMARELSPEHIRDVFERTGIGQSPGTGFPGESPGSLPDKRRWSMVERINLSFGYGLAATPLQLATAYSVLANNGIKRPASLVKVDTPPPGEQVLDATISRQIRDMLVTVTEAGGTGTRAAIPGYTVAGKTGTVHKVGPGGYMADRYMALFAGMAPADDPRLVTVVIIDDPRAEGYFGGVVAAPVFSRVVGDALRLLRVPPDAHPEGLLADKRERAGGPS